MSLEECLMDGVPFNSGAATLKRPEGHNAVTRIAKVVHDYPLIPLKILGYTGKPSGRWRTREHCVKWALQRARAVRHGLEQRGCRNYAAAKGMGYTDSLGPRIEVIPCSFEDVDKIEKEVSIDEWATGGDTLEQELADALGEGLTFETDSVYLDGEGRKRFAEVANVLSRHPALSFRIVGYIGAEGSADLALGRNSSVHRALVDAGCTCKLLVDSSAVELPSSSGQLSGRCELEVASQASDNLADLLKGNVRARKSVEIVFGSPTGLRHVIFNRKPIGLSYQNLVPLVVSKVHPHGLAEELGIQVGWEVRMISSRHVSGLNFAEVQETLVGAIDKLPLALSYHRADPVMLADVTAERQDAGKVADAQAAGTPELESAESSSHSGLEQI